MKRPHSLAYNIFIFVLAQLAWLTLLGIWIYWYINNYILFSEVENKLSPRIVSEGRNILVLFSGLALLIMVSVAMSLLFHRLIIQFNMTQLYDNFIANVTHELKSPLASIQLALETFQLHKLSRARQKEFIEMMLKDTSRLNHLINAILEIPALEQKKIAHKFSIYPIGPLINELLEESRDQFGLGSEIITIPDETECLCVVDRNAMKIVLDNLIDNSIKYCTGPLKIVIAFHCSQRYFIMDYKDQGIGMSVKESKKVFDKFFRIQNRNSPDVRGTGLGLYWVREIIRFHGGRISISSRGYNKGTSFRIELPIYQASKMRYLRNLLKIAQNRQPLKGGHDER